MFHHSKEMFNPGTNLRRSAIGLTRFLRQRMMTLTPLVGKIFGLWRALFLVERGASMMVVSTIVPRLSFKPFSLQ